MGRVFIVCPVTGQQVPTGLVMDPEEFDRAVLQDNVLRCPACGRIHTWSKQDAQLREEPPRK